MANMTLRESFTAIANAIRTKGGTSGTMTVAEMPTAIANIPSGSGENNYGRITVDENGNATQISGALDLSDIVTIPADGLYSAYRNCHSITSVDLSNLTTVSDRGLYETFYYCNNITTVDMSSLTSVGSSGLTNVFWDCRNLTSVDLSNLTSLGNKGIYYAFIGCQKLTSVDLSKLSSVGNSGLQYAFSGCYKLEVIHFDEASSVPNLTDGLNWNNAGIDVTGGYKVVVPDNLVDSWKSAQYWSEIADHIVSVSDYYGVAGLRFKNVGDSTATVQLTKVGSPTSILLEYTRGGKTPTYLPYTIGDEIEVESGASIWIRSSVDSQGFSIGPNNYYQFVLDGEFEASKSVMYLLVKDGGDDTTIPYYAFVNLFKDCDGLVVAPELPSTTLSANCYNGMFTNCTSLTVAPKLPASTLADKCYQDMFSGCSALNNIDISEYEGDFSATSGVSPFKNWVDGVASSGAIYYGGSDTTVGVSAIPEGWEINPFYGLTFVSRQPNSTISMAKRGSAPNVSLVYSLDKRNWDTFTVGTTTVTLQNVGDKMYIRAGDGKHNQTMASSYNSNYNCFVLTGQFDLEGDLMSLVDCDLENRTTPTYAFTYLFKNCTSLIDAGGAKIGADGTGTDGAKYVFDGCSNMTKGPLLEFKTIGNYALEHFFYGCSSLTEIKIPYFTAAFGSGSTGFSEWVSGVPSTGTFYYNGTSTSRGTSAIPNGWTIAPFED